MKLVACVDENWAIGKGSELLFHIKHDMKRFTHLTMGGLCIMGSKTFYSLPAVNHIRTAGGDPLPGRKCLVISKDYENIEKTYPGVMAVPSIYEALEIASQYDTDKVYVIGGAAIYRALYRYCDTAYITLVKRVCSDADKFMINLDSDAYEWCCNSSSDIFKTQKDTEYRFLKYKNNNVWELL